MHARIKVTCPACEEVVHLSPDEVVIVYDLTEGSEHAKGAYSYLCPGCSVAAWIPGRTDHIIRLSAAGVLVRNRVRSALDRCCVYTPLTSEDIVDFRISLWGDGAAFRVALDEWLMGE